MSDTTTISTPTAIAVGKGGRGFVVNGYVITAAHCLPADDDNRLLLPPAHLGRYAHENTYQNLLGPLGGEQTVWASCVFVDPMSDIAVLGGPDDQVLPEQWMIYLDQIVCDANAFTVGSPPLSHTVYEGGPDGYYIDPDELQHGTGHIQSLEGEWIPCVIERWHRQRRFLFVKDEALVRSGMSGSPVLSKDGKAIAILSTNNQCPVITECLPQWLLREMKVDAGWFDDSLPF
jgi:Trypsin-like peptidase domain